MCHAGDRAGGGRPTGNNRWTAPFNCGSCRSGKRLDTPEPLHSAIKECPVALGVTVFPRRRAAGLGQAWDQVEGRTLEELFPEQNCRPGQTTWRRSATFFPKVGAGELGPMDIYLLEQAERRNRTSNPDSPGVQTIPITEAEQPYGRHGSNIVGLFRWDGRRYHLMRRERLAEGRDIPRLGFQHGKPCDRPVVQGVPAG